MAKIRNIDDERRKKRKKKPKKKSPLFFSIIIFITVIVIVVVSFQATDMMERYNADTEAQKTAAGFPVPIEDNRKISIESSQGKLVVVTDTHINIYDDQGHLYLSILHGLGDPVCVVVGDRFLYYSRGGKVAHLMTFYGKEEGLYTVDGEIISADLSSKGYVAIAYKNNKGVSRTDIYYKKEILEWRDTDNFVADVHFSSDGQGIYIMTYNADSSGQFLTEIKEYNRSEDKPKVIWSFSGILGIQLGYANAKLMLITDQDVKLLKEDGTSESYSYDGKNLKRYRFNRSGLILEFGEFTSFDARNLVVLNQSLEIKMNYNSDVSIDDFYLDGNTLYVLSNGLLSWYNQEGEKLSELAAPEGVVGFVILGRDAYVLTAVGLYDIPLSGNAAKMREGGTLESQISSLVSLDPVSSKVKSEDMNDIPSELAMSDVLENSSSSDDTSNQIQNSTLESSSSSTSEGGV